MPIPQKKSLLGRSVLGAAALALSLLRPVHVEAASPYLVVPEPGVAEASPAYRYANMADEDAFNELDRRKILYQRVGPVLGVRAPIRLTGRLHGVYFHSSLPPEQRVTSIFEILDARLALALDDFAALLERHEIDEVVHYTMYRPNVARPGHDDHDDDDGSKGAASTSGSGRRRSSSPSQAQPKAEAADDRAPAKTPVEAEGKRASTKTPIETEGKRASTKTPIETEGKRAPSMKAPAVEKPALGGKGAKDAKGALDAKDAKDAKDLKKGGGRRISGAKQKTPTPKPAKETRELIDKAPAPAAQPANTKASALKPQVASKTGAPTRLRAGTVASVKTPSAPRIHKTTWAAPGTRHPAGLAIDVGLLRKRDGRWLSVASHFHGRIGDKTCGDGVTVPESLDARELRALVCEAQDLGIFTYVLTPNYNAAHADHYHMEIRAGVRWFLYH